MKNEILDEILEIEHFILEQDTGVDGVDVHIRPLYIELIALYPFLQKKLAYELSGEIKQFNPKILYAIESSILPIAALVANNLEIPLSIIRKHYNYKHEKDEPVLFINNSLKKASAVLLDDAVWSGKTISHTFNVLEKNDIPLPNCYFVFDFLNFNKGGDYLHGKYYAHLKKRAYWLSYRDVIERAYVKKIISRDVFEKTMKLFNAV